MVARRCTVCYRPIMALGSEVEPHCCRCKPKTKVKQSFLKKIKKYFN